jgi:hypothetical protein
MLPTRVRQPPLRLTCTAPSVCGAAVPDGWWEAAQPVWNEANWDEVSTKWEDRYWDLVQFLYRERQYPRNVAATDRYSPETPLWRWVTTVMSQVTALSHSSGTVMGHFGPCWPGGAVHRLPYASREAPQLVSWQPRDECQYVSSATCGWAGFTGSASLGHGPAAKSSPAERRSGLRVIGVGGWMS